MPAREQAAGRTASEEILCAAGERLLFIKRPADQGSLRLRGSGGFCLTQTPQMCYAQRLPVGGLLALFCLCLLGLRKGRAR